MSLISDIQDLLEEATTNTFWTKAQIYDAANWAQIRVWEDTRHDKASETLTVPFNTDLVAIPDTIMIPLYVVMDGKEYFCSTQAKLEEYDRNWRAATPAQPKWFLVWDSLNLRVWPKANATYVFTLFGVRYPPTELAVGTEDITAPRLLKQAIVHTAAGMVLSLTRPDLAEGMLSEAAQLENKFKIQLRNRGGHRIDRLRPGNKFAHAQGGVISIGKHYS
jgi:hypothetical protein